MKAIQQNPHIIDSLSCILNILLVIDLSFTLFDTSWGVYSISKESKYTAVFLSINNESQCVPLLFLLSKFMTYAPSFVQGKFFLEKSPLI